MRKITMKRKNKSSEAPKNSEAEDTENIQSDEPEADSNSSNQENGTTKKSKNKKQKHDTSVVESSDVENNDTQPPPEKQVKQKKKNKRGRKSKTNEIEESNGTAEEAATTEEEESYEVEQIIDQKIVKGNKHYLIRWKGYGEESDTWEPEATLDCPELVTKFLNSRKSSDSPKKGKKRPSSSSKSPKKSKGSAADDDDDEGSEKVGEFEVDRILEVHFKKNGSREFLVHWKGYHATENTWEPEENMSCTNLIERFMEKVNKARATDTRELRVNRKPTKHFTLSMQQTGRRLSRRNLGKQRTQYQELD